jgi:DnaJ-class molecular chaperone
MNVNVWIEQVRMEKHGSMYRAPVREPTLKTAESPATVRAKRPVQHRKHVICPTCLGTGVICTATPNGSACLVCSGTGKLRAFAQTLAAIFRALNF